MRHTPILHLAAYPNTIRELKRLEARTSRAPLSGVAFSRSELSRAHHHLRQFSKQLRAIHRLTARNEQQSAEAAIIRALGSYSARMSAALQSFDLINNRPAFTAVEERADIIDVFSPCNAPIRVEIKVKVGGHRLIHQPPWQHRVRHWLVSAVFAASGVGSEYETSTSGLGSKYALDLIARQIKAGHLYWATADIKNFYPSVKPEHLKGITPIPAERLKSVLFTMDDVPIRLYKDGTPISCKTLESEARLGLAQGSKPSPMIASALLGRVLRPIAPLANPVLSYADDIAMGAHDQSDADSFNDALEERLTALKAGPLALKFKRTQNALEGVTFIGRRLRLKSWDGKTKVRQTPSPKSFRKILSNAQRRFGDALELLAYDDDANDLDEYLRQVARGYGWAVTPLGIYNTKTWIAHSLDGAA